MVELQQRFAVCHTQPWSFISSRAHETHVPVKCEALKKYYGTIRVHVHSWDSYIREKEMALVNPMRVVQLEGQREVIRA